MQCWVLARWGYVLWSVTLEAVMCVFVLRTINICGNKQGFLAPVAWGFAPGACEKD